MSSGRGPRPSRRAGRRSRRRARRAGRRGGPAGTSTGSAPAASASSSMKRLDREDVEVGPQRPHRRGAQRGVGLRWPTTRRGPTSYAGTALRVVPPPAAGGGSVAGGSGVGCGEVGAGEQAGRAGVSRAARCAPWLHTSWRPAGDPAAVERRPQSVAVIAGASGPQVSSSGRVQRSSTGRPGTARASSDGVEGRVVGGVVAVAAGVLDVLHRDRRRSGGRGPRRSRRAARGCPGCGAARARRRRPHRAMAALGRDRGVGQERLGVRRLDDARPGARSALLVEDRHLLVRARAQPGGQVVLVGQRLALRPTGRPRASRSSARSTSASRSPTTPTNEPSRTSVDTGCLRRSAVVEGQQAAHRDRRRPQHPAVQQARRAAGRRGSGAGRAPCRAGRAAARCDRRPTRATGADGADRREVGVGVEGGDAGDVRRRPGTVGPASARTTATDVAQRGSGLQHRQAAGGEALVGPVRWCAAATIRIRSSGSAERVGGELGERGERCPGRARPCRRRTSTLARRPTETQAAEPGVGDDVGGRACGHRGRLACGEDGVDDPPVGAAAAEVAVERLGDPVRVGVGLLVEQRRGPDDDPGDAEAALGGLPVEDRRAAPGAAASSAESPSTVVTARPSTCHTGVWHDGTGPRAVEAYEAGTAQALPAAEPGARPGPSSSRRTVSSGVSASPRRP